MLSEPVRLYLYGLLGPLVGLLAAHGVVAEELTSLWLALGAALLGVSATELARSRVTPLSDPRDDDGHQLTP